MNAFKRLKNITSRPDFLPLVIVFFFVWLAAKPLFGSGYFNMHDDLQMMRQLEMEKCFLDGQIPCRWVPDMGYGFGYPLFNFYPPLPYVVGQVFRVVGYSYMDTAKALFIVAFLLSGISMYFFGKRFFGRLGGALAAVFYVWAPYHSVDIYVRGAMNESWGLIWFPFILLFSYELISRIQKGQKLFANGKYIIFLALSWAALLLSHNLMVIVFTPFFALWSALWLVYFKNWKVIPSLALSGVWAFGFAAFFTLPVFLEKNIVQTDTLVRGYYEYTAHFPSASQLLFSRFWGYGPSVWMTQDDKMSFQIGWFHWIVPLVVAVFFALRYIKTRKLSPLSLAFCILFTIGWAATFMAHPRSTPVWEMFKPLQFVQFPWRYLTMVILGFSFAAGAVVALLPKALRYIGVFVLILCVVVYGWSFFLPEHGKLGPLTDEEKFTGAAWELQQTAGIYDYLPNTAKTAPKGPRKVQAEIVEGKGEVIEGNRGTNWERFQVNAESDTIVRLGILAFPDWKVTVDGVEVESFVPETEEWGRLYIKVPAGNHSVYAKLTDTPTRTAGNILTVISWGALGLLLIYRKRESKA